MNIGILSGPASSHMNRREGFASYLKEIRPRVNDRIQEVVEGHLFDDHLLPLLLRGKRLRAGVLLLIHDALTGEPERTGSHALDLACALELAHAASLMVDDMIDEDTERRGLVTVHISQGTKTAMLNSIGTLSLPYTLVAPHQGEYVCMLAEAQRKMTLGVLREMLTIPSLPTTAWYEAIITLKTGCLFGLSSEWGFMAATEKRNCNSREREMQKLLREKWRMYGIHLGRSMQIADDIVDLQKRMRGEGTGKPGSEMLLLKAVGADELFKESFSDTGNCSPDWLKLPGVMNSEIIIRQLHHLLHEEGEKALGVLQSLEALRELPSKDSSIGSSRECTVLRTLGHTIANIMLKEAPVKELPVNAGLIPSKLPEILIKE
jgi:geranylgeranyl diphosphate synthase type II